jgi:hypothetical protein
MVDDLAEITNPFPGKIVAWEQSSENLYKCTAGAVPGPIVWVSIGSGAALAAIADDRILANISGGSAIPIANTLSDIIDACISNVQGRIIYRGASGWVSLAVGTDGYVLTTHGAAADPTWAAPGAAGSDTQVLFNDGGAVGADAGLTYNKTNNILFTDQITLAVGANVAVNRQTLSATLTLTTASKRYQNLDPDGSARNVDLPAEAEGMAFFIVNSGNGAEVITVRNDAAGTIDTINNNQGLSVISDGTVWIAIKATVVIV